MDWIKIRILLNKLEAQLRYDVLPDGDKREKLRKHIAECEEYLAHWDGSSREASSNDGQGVNLGNIQSDDQRLPKF